MILLALIILGLIASPVIIYVFAFITTEGILHSIRKTLKQNKQDNGKEKEKR